MLIHEQDKKLLRAIALYQQNKHKRGIIATVLRTVAKLQHMFWSVLTGSEINRGAQIHPTARFPHLNGVVMHADARVDEGCLIMQQVTLGQTACSGAPHVHAGAYIGAGAKVLGEVTVGRNARIGANAVVLKDVPENATAVGVPARIVRNRG